MVNTVIFKICDFDGEEISWIFIGRQSFILSQNFLKPVGRFGFFASVVVVIVAVVVVVVVVVVIVVVGT